MLNFSLAHIYALCISLLVALLYNSYETKNASTFNHPPHLGRQNILILTAHPDDECFFFAPTIAALIRRAKEQPKDNPIELFSLCLSNGGQDGLGGIRTVELERSLDILGLKPENHWVLDEPGLEDNITVYWDKDVIANAVRPYIIEHNITTILTFDTRGISGHPNHRSLPAGMKHLVSTMNKPPRLFSLMSVPLMSKYQSFIAPTLSKMDLYLLHTWAVADRFIARTLVLIGVAEFEEDPKEGDAIPEWGLAVFVSGFSDYWTAFKAARQHQSQLVWFRWLYVTFSRYMWVNEWVEVEL